MHSRPLTRWAPPSLLRRAPSSDLLSQSLSLEHHDRNTTNASSRSVARVATLLVYDKLCIVVACTQDLHSSRFDKLDRI